MEARYLMTSRKLREQFLKFFEKKGHKIVSSSPLIPTDPSVLFTTAGMQQFKPYYLVEKSPYGQNVCSCQKCFRTSDIEEVGDESHLTFLEMLGNFSFGGYFKKEAISWADEFIFKELKLPLKETVFTVFEGDKDVPEDKESVEIWKELGIPENKIKKCGRLDNFWGPTGKAGPCGPTTEIHIKGIEVWNLVFNEYYQDNNKQLTPLVQKGVDTGMGLERLAMIVQNKSSVFETDLFEPIIGELQKYRGRTPANLKGGRIIADHVKSAVFLISDGILPSNVERGYVLRRILRRAIRYGKLLNLPANFLILLAQKVIEIYKNVYPEVKSKEADILTVIQNEEEKFEKTLQEGLKQFENISKKGNISGVDSFHLYDTYGFPLELTIELAKERNLNIDKKGFEEAFKYHQEISRAGVESKFGGVGKEATYEATKLHTATHLLQAALRKILGEHVKQMGSDITSQRLRFDFSHSQKMTENEIKKVQSLVNQKIKEDLEVKKEEMNYKAAIKSGALALGKEDKSSSSPLAAARVGKEDKSSFSPSFPFRGNSVFKEKYPEIVTVYSVEEFSKEICAGPHVKRTSELGLFKIIKEESSGAGVRRIRAILE